MLQASSAQRLGKLLNILQYTGQTSQQGITWSELSIGPRLTNNGLEDHQMCTRRSVGFCKKKYGCTHEGSRSHTYYMCQRTQKGTYPKLSVHKSFLEEIIPEITLSKKLSIGQEKTIGTGFIGRVNCMKTLNRLVSERSF